MQRYRPGTQRLDVIRHHRYLTVTEYNGQPVSTTSTAISKGGAYITTVYRGSEDGQTVAVLVGTKVIFHYCGRPGGEQEQTDLIRSTSRMGPRRVFETRAGDMQWKWVHSEWQLFPAQASERSEPLLRIKIPGRKDKTAYNNQNDKTDFKGCCGRTSRNGPQLDRYMELSPQAVTISPFQLLIVNRGRNVTVQATEILEKAIVVLAIIGKREADQRAAAGATFGTIGAGSGMAAAGVGWGGAGNAMAAGGAGWDGAGTGMGF